MNREPKTGRDSIKGEKHFLEGLIHSLSSMKRSNKLFVRNFRRVSTSKLTKTTIVPVGLVLCQAANVMYTMFQIVAKQIKHPWESRILLWSFLSRTFDISFLDHFVVRLSREQFPFILEIIESGRSDCWRWLEIDFAFHIVNTKKSKWNEIKDNY